MRGIDDEDYPGQEVEELVFGMTPERRKEIKRLIDEAGPGRIIPVTPQEMDEIMLDTKMSPPPERVSILSEASQLTAGARDKEYGNPVENMGCAGQLKNVFRSFLRRQISPAEQEAIDMVLTKISRLACGQPKRDTYVDAAAYCAIAGECALYHQRGPQTKQDDAGGGSAGR